MPLSALRTSQIDPTSIFELFRGNYGTELLACAAGPLNVFGRLASGPRAEADLQRELGLADRPTVVLFAALKAMGLLAGNGNNHIDLTPLAREHLLPGGPFDVSDYIGLAAESPGVKEMLKRLTSNRPAGAEDERGAAFIFREGIESAMERQASARHLTLALAGRAKNVAPYLAQQANLEDATTLLDIGGGTGIYSIACLQRYPRLRAIVWDRPEVLKIAGEFARDYGVAERLELVPGDMFTDDVPPADVMLLSNILHDWDVPQCRVLIGRCVTSLATAGRLLIHDVFLNDAHDGPLPVALYSAALFTMTEGRAYSAGEYASWLGEAGLTVQPPRPTLIHCGLLGGVRAR